MSNLWLDKRLKSDNITGLIRGEQSMSGFMQYYRSLPLESHIIPMRFEGNLNWHDFNVSIRDAELIARVVRKNPKSVRIAWNIFVYGRAYTTNIINHNQFRNLFGMPLEEFRRKPKLIAEVRKILVHFDSRARFSISRGMRGFQVLSFEHVPSHVCFYNISPVSMARKFINVPTGFCIAPEDQATYTYIEEQWAPDIEFIPEPLIEIPKFFKNPFQGLPAEAVFALAQ